MYPKLGKRLLDLVVAVMLLIALMPLLLVVWSLVRLKLGCPALFAQERPGLAGKPFTLYKFRSMTDERDASGELLPDAQRLTSFGRLLRRTSVDELPELYNVIRGDMSLVGPRPLLMQYLGRYTPEQMRRHERKPGITGWAQVNGRNAVDWERRFALDLWYVHHQSLGLDLKILVMTIARIFACRDISQPGQATMREYGVDN